MPCIHKIPPSRGLTATFSPISMRLAAFAGFDCCYIGSWFEPGQASAPFSLLLHILCWLLVYGTQNLRPLPADAQQQERESLPSATNPWTQNPGIF